MSRVATKPAMFHTQFIHDLAMIARSHLEGASNLSRRYWSLFPRIFTPP
jgi:hypothetical protein